MSRSVKSGRMSTSKLVGFVIVPLSHWIMHLRRSRRVTLTRNASFQYFIQPSRYASSIDHLSNLPAIQ
jgi:hypothetical protein